MSQTVPVFVKQKHAQTCSKHKTRKKALTVTARDVSEPLLTVFINVVPSRRSRPTLTVVRSWKWQRQNTLDLLLIILLMMNLYLLKLKIVICFQAKKHHHINCWIKSSLDYHELFSLYRRAIHILQYDESITDYFAGQVSGVQANIINWILCEKNGILQILANPINDRWNVSLCLYHLLSILICTCYC